MSLETLRKKAKKRIELDQLPESLVAKLTEWQFKEDSRGRECLYVTLITKEGEQLTQKYTDFHLSYLIENLEKLGVTSIDDIKNKWIIWHKTTFRIGNPRLLPTTYQTKIDKSEG